jgi:uncharacterized repeat protein (TIGR01451 family)
MKAEKLQKIFQIGLPPLAALLLMAVWLFFLPGEAIAKTTVAPMIREFAANHTGTDTNEFAQVKGSPSADYSTYNLLQDSNEILIAKSAPAQVLPGGTYTYTITVENPFTYTLTGVMVGDLLPAGTSFVSALDGGGYTTTPFPILSWSVGDLAPSASVDLRFVVTAPNFETTVVNNVYGVWATNYSAYSLGAPVYTVVGSTAQIPSEILITKSAPAQVLPGSVFTYTITVENPFTYTLTGVEVGDLLPLDTSFVSVLDSGVYTTTPFPILSWSVGDLGPSASVDLRFVVTAPNFETTVVNHIYEVGATNISAYTLGASVSTVVGDHILIRQIQGSGDTSPFVGGDIFGMQGIVTNIHYNNSTSTNADGFFMQDPNPDADLSTSEGIYIYAPAYASSVQVGDAITVSGTVEEYFSLTEISSVTSAITGTTIDTILPGLITLPVPVGTTLEPYEGMLVEIDDLTVSQNYFQGRYGQLTLSSQGRMYNPTNGNGLGDTFDLNMRRMIILDDNTSGQNPVPIPYVGQDNTNRAGDLIADLTGTLDYGPINSSFPPARHFRLMPTDVVTITRLNQRTSAPEAVGGNLKVASFNVLNYFTTLDTGSLICGPSGGLGCRGANTPEELTRQRTKIITALLAIDADVVGLIEIENHATDNAVIDLVTGLNNVAGAGTYGYIGTGPVGTDAIKVALIYKPSRVTPVGNYLVDANPIHDRPPVAQAFSLNLNGDVFTPVVNHFKSKGSCPAPGDPNADQGDGQGCWNLKRVEQAKALLVFIDAIKTSTGDNDVLVIGDLNSYGIEDPTITLTSAGLTDEADLYIPAASRYSYVFDGQAGYLDHALATTSLDSQIVNATFWHINADEPPFLDYNTEFNPPQYYQPDAYRSSDHEPVVVGINLRSPSISLTKVVDPAVDVDLGGTVTYTITLQNSGGLPASGVLLTDTLPAAVDFGGWVQQSGATVANDVITWSGNLTAGGSVVLVFTAIVVDDVAFNGQTVMNSAVYQYGVESGSADASFSIRYVNYIYLPITTRDFVTP